MAVTSPPSITALPDPPDPDDRSSFNTLAYPWSVAQQTFATEVAAVATNVYNNATEAYNAASTATTQAAVATSAATAAGAVAWVSGTTYAEGDVRYDTTDFLTYRRKTAGAGTTRPGLDSTNWALLVVSHNIVRRAITGADTVVVTDKAGLLDITSGTFTLAYTAAAALGSGFWCVVRNSGTGDVTHDPANSETIDGLTSFVMYPGEARLIQCDGSAFRSVVLSGFNKTFTSSGTFTKPPGYTRFAGQLWAGGGSGRKDTADTQFRFGGGGGACATFDFPASSFGTTETITIGSGGAAKTTTADGDDGGNSSIGSLVTAYGGEGGKTSASTTQGGSAYIANVPMATSGATPSSAYHAGCSQQGASTTVLGGGACGNAVYGNTVYGGAGGGTISSDDSTLYNPATYSTTVFGGAGGNASVASSGSDGTAPGGGGGATKSGAQSGAGARGELRIWGVV